MDSRHELLSPLCRKTPSKVVLLVLDGVGDIRTDDQPRTPLEAAHTPHLDALAQRSALGRLQPATTAVTPGSGPGHLALFGYDPTSRALDIGRGVLEALGLALHLGPETVAARANFATVDQQGLLIDRRAGRLPNEESRRLCAKLQAVLEQDPSRQVRVRVAPGEGYRFVLLFDGSVEGANGPALSADLEDTDPQVVGERPRPLRARAAAAQATVAAIAPVLDKLIAVLAQEERGNSFLLRGFSKLPHLPSFGELYQLDAGAFAGYPLYRGVAKACGMKVFECGKSLAEVLDQVAKNWQSLDYFFLHVKQTDMAGEDGDFSAKVAVIEAVDAQLPRLLDLQPDTLAITGDHSTPVPMKAHSWHPVPLLLHSRYSGRDHAKRFTEATTAAGTLGTIPARELMGLLLANAGKLAKFGA